MSKLFSIAVLGLLAITATAMADEARPNWTLDGDLYLGTMIPYGTETNPGVTMGGKAKVQYESTGRNVLVFGELMGEGFNNGNSSNDIKFSQFYLNSAVMIGAKAVKWKTPLNISVSRDIVSNEQIAVRYAFSGLYIKMIDDTKGEGELHQVLETMADFVVESISYQNVPWSNNTQVAPASGRTILGLYAALKYEIEKRGWGSTMAVELVQDLSPSYTKVNAKLVGFKQLSGELKNLRPYIEIDGTLDHDVVDPSGSLQGAVRIFGGISGRLSI